MPALARFGWFVLASNLGVIAWGAYVRATGSGAGCGNHWPLCNGEVVPRSAGVATLIEFSHRLTSGLALAAVLALLVWTFRGTRPGHPARRGAVLSMVFILLEAGVGAGLVLFELVADNATLARAMFMGVHLVNTFFLLGALALTSWWLSGGADISLRRGRTLAAAATGCAALLVAGASGAVAALGDTLFPAASLGEAVAADLSASSHLLLRLRVFHPLLAIGAAVTVVVLARRLTSARSGPGLALRGGLVPLVVFQLVLGFLNVVLLAPVWLQLVHLLVADAIWIGFVVISADALARPLPAAAVQAA
jgi:cytochrome c oxidase assembly protein subunit 15